MISTIEQLDSYNPFYNDDLYARFSRSGKERVVYKRCSKARKPKDSKKFFWLKITWNTYLDLCSASCK